MKTNIRINKTATLTPLSLLLVPVRLLAATALAITILANQSLAAFPQQPVTGEKKRAMSKFDPTDIFPEAHERGGKDRNKRERTSPQATGNSILASTETTTTKESGSSSRRNSRRKRSAAPEPETPATDLAVATTPTSSSTPSQLPTQLPAGTSAATTATAEPSPTITDAAASTTTATESGSTAAPVASQPLTAMNLQPAPPITNGSQLPKSGLSLPVILTLLSVVLLALILVLTKLAKQFRKPAA